MQDNKTPIISICLPCNGRIGYVRKTLDSIFKSNNDVTLSDYEVVISDNDSKHAISELVKEFTYPNLKYYTTTCEGFMNSYYALTYGKGTLLKLHNSQVTFKKGALAKLINEVKDNTNSKNLIFYTNGFLFKNKSVYFDSFDEFFYSLSYWPSWSNGFSIWKDDFDKIHKETSLNRLFPHTSLFITQWYKSHFIINDCHWFDTQRVVGRSGHNKFKAFTIDFPSLIEECYKNNHLTRHTKKHILNDLMMEFLPTLLFNKYVVKIEHFDMIGYKKNIKIYFPWYAYLLSWLMVPIVPFRLFKRRITL